MKGANEANDVFTTDEYITESILSANSCTAVKEFANILLQLPEKLFI